MKEGVLKGEVQSGLGKATSPGQMSWGRAQEVKAEILKSTRACRESNKDRFFYSFTIKPSSLGSMAVTFLIAGTRKQPKKGFVLTCGLRSDAVCYAKKGMTAGL